MKRSIEFVLVATAVVLFGFATSLLAQESVIGSPIGNPDPPEAAPVHYPSAPGTLVIPKSSLPQPTPAGHKFAAHTNVEALIPAGIEPNEAPPFPGYGYETPASLACVYGLITAGFAGCNPYNAPAANPIKGGAKSIAIVDAYDDPSAPGDLAWFSLQFGLPLALPQFKIVYANNTNSFCVGQVPPVDFSGGWEIEESLDVEWSHAMAPSADIYLVEACTNSDTDLQQAVLVANNLVACGNSGINSTSFVLTVCSTPTLNGEVSMSWGGGEFIGENASDSCATPDDSCFTMPGVVYFASSGDSPGVIWPGTSPNVVSAGGLSNRRNAVTFNIVSAGDSTWVDAGAGESAIETIPSYQSGNAVVTAICNAGFRCVPDVSFDADPNTGVYVYDSFPIEGVVFGPWWVVGGTSVSSPALAGIINNAASKSGTWYASTNAELTKIYGEIPSASYFTPIVSGFCGEYMGFTAVPGGYNFCTGGGAVHSYNGK